MNFKKLIVSSLALLIAFITLSMPVNAINVEDTTIEPVEANVFEMTNEERVATGDSILVYDYALQAAADLRAQEIAVLFSHTRPDGTMCYTADERINGENIAYGYIDAEAVMVGWMNSPGHKANILTDEFRCMAVGHAYINETHYWVQLFSVDKPVNPVRFNDDTVIPDQYYIDPIKVTANVSTSTYLYVEAKNYSGNYITDGEIKLTLDGTKIPLTTLDDGYAKTTEMIDMTKKYLVSVEGYRNAYYINPITSPSSVEAKLLKNGEVYKTVTLSANNNWTYTFENLIDDDSTYKVQFTTIPNYLCSTIKDFDGNYKFSAVPQNKSVSCMFKKEDKIDYNITKGTVNFEGNLNIKLSDPDNNPVSGKVEILSGSSVVKTVDVVDGSASVKLDLSKTYTIKLVGSNVSIVYEGISLPQSYKFDLYKNNNFKESVVLSNENNWTYSFNDYETETYNLKLKEIDNFTASVNYNGATCLIDFKVKDQSVSLVKSNNWDTGNNDNIPVIPETPIISFKANGTVKNIPCPSGTFKEVFDYAKSLGFTTPKIVNSWNSFVESWYNLSGSSATLITEEVKAPIIKLSVNGLTYSVSCPSGTYKEVFERAVSLGISNPKLVNDWNSSIEKWYNVSGTTAKVIKEETNIPVYTKTLTMDGISYLVKCTSGTYKEVFSFAKAMGHTDFQIIDEWGTTVFSFYKVNEDSKCYLLES